MANKDSLQKVFDAITEAEKEYGADHRYRHTFSALRNARYSFSKVRANAEFDSPGREASREVGAKEKVPQDDPKKEDNVVNFQQAAEQATARLASSGEPSNDSG